MEVVSKYVVHVSHSRVHNWCTSHTYVRLLLLAYAWFWTCVHWHIFSLWFLKVFKLFLVLLFWFFKNLMLYIWPLIYLFLLRRDIFFTIYICFKETLFFNFSHKLSTKHFSLRTSICSSGRECVLIILFQLYGSIRLGFLKAISSGWVSMTPPPLPQHSTERTNPILL